MDWTAAGAVRPRAGAARSGEKLYELVAGEGPDDEVPGQPHEDADVQLGGRAVKSRVHEVTFLSLIVAVQLCWLTTLGYALFLLVS